VTSDRRPLVIRALVAFQALYDYLDTISEQPAANSFANNHQLHRALVAALDPSCRHVDYYAHHSQRDDGGYLHEQIEVCRAICRGLPSFPLVAGRLRRAAVRAMESQAFVHTAPAVPGSWAGVARWADQQTPAAAGLSWWESAAAAGSSLAIHALVAAAADPALTPGQLATVERAYFPWAGALQGLLDSVVDATEDAGAGSLAYVSCYPSPTVAAERLAFIARRTTSLVEGLPQAAHHRVIVAAMASLYLSAPAAGQPGARQIRSTVLTCLGGAGRFTLLVFWLRRWDLSQRGPRRFGLW
jgi:tetraprenyl-beta-curcumene synthase